MNPRLLTVFMVTRNRPASLEKCLARTRAVLPKEIQIIVFDDASTEGERVRAIVEAQSNTVYLRSSTLVGPGEGRNRCLRQARTPYCLSLDDDCYLDPLPDLSRWLANHPEDRNIAAVGFRYCNLPSRELAPAGDVSGPANGFHGGASLLNRELVLKAGGYLDWLVFACEDTELGMRLRRLGYGVWYEPTVIIMHDRSYEGRDDNWGSYYYVRNTVVMNLIYGKAVSGLLVGVLRAVRRGINTPAPKKTVAGIVGGLSLYFRCRHARKELFASARRYEAQVTQVASERTSCERPDTAE
jgi:GT2 family glycosyltransferase